MKISGKKKLIAFIVLVIIIPLLSSTILLKYREETRFHGDESGWISSGYYYTNLLLKGDFTWRKWHKEELGPWGYMNPHLGKWLIGLPLKLHFDDQEFSRLYNFSKTREENEKEGNIPPREMLLHSRAVSAIFGGLCCLLVFTIGHVCYNLWIGVIAATLLLGNKLFIIHATRAMTDITYNFFLICLGLWALLLLPKVSKKRMVFVSILFGALSGLACSVKITGIVVGSLFFTAMLIYKYTVHKNKKEMLLFLVAFFFSALAIVYILNPLFWPDFPMTRGSLLIHELTSFPGELKKIIAAREIPEGNTLEMYIEKYPQVTNLSHVFMFPYLFVKWNSFMNNQKNSPSASWHGNRLQTFHKSLFIKHSTFVLEGFFLLVGIIICSNTMYNALKNNELALCGIPFLYFLSNYIFILIFMKINWGRYYLSTIIASKIIIAVGIYGVSTYMYQYFCRSKYMPPPNET
jgi:4-amino-4-deoxy-L-arabinose transferase-like glycosyltransferase